jgi:hypothetical protein
MFGFYRFFCSFTRWGFSDPPDNVANSMFSLIPWVSSEVLRWFGNHRWIFMTVPFFVFTSAGFFSLVGVHNCRKALWDSRNMTNKADFEALGRYKRLFWVRAGVLISYGIATFCFLIIAPLSIPLN